MPDHRKILIGLIVGAGLGVLANAFAADRAWLQGLVTYGTEPVGRIFIRLLIMLVVPIVFSALVVGVGELELKDIGRLGAKTLIYTLVISTLAVLIGMLLVSVLEPGSGVPQSVRESAHSTISAAPPPKGGSVMDLVVQLVPDNPLKAAAGGDMLGFIVFSLIFGIGLAQTKSEAAGRLKQMIHGLYDVVMTVIQGVLRLAPIGVAALLFTMTARTGLDVLQQIAAYVFVVLLGLFLHAAVVYSAAVRVLGGMSPLHFFRSVRLAMATAFSTASSAATLPTALQVAEENLKLPAHVSRFVLTAGATMNQNGTALFEGVTVLFLAQVYGVELSLGQQALVMGISILAGIGTAGVPAGSLPVIAMILGLFHIPAEGLGLILG
ncbi:MAG TPA: dicarboxylate/amino acid:cation symporter, partial [Polyangiaceae bacterium]|nr:dicarboxylate/amino acid:cation symporter [Polyangiaceae bacterium]